MNTTHIPDDLIDCPTAGKLIGTHPATVRRWIASGALPGYRRGSRYLVSRADVLATIRPVDAAAERDALDAQRPPTRAELTERERWTDETLRRIGVRK